MPKYEATRHITYNGTEYPIGSKVELSAKQAAKLPVRLLVQPAAAEPEKTEPAKAKK